MSYFFSPRLNPSSTSILQTWSRAPCRRSLCATTKPGRSSAALSEWELPLVSRGLGAVLMGGVLCFHVLVVYVSFNCWKDYILHDLSLTKIQLINVIECEENLFSFHCCSLLYAFY